MLATTSTTLWYTMRATGVVALVLLTVTMVLGILTAGRADDPIVAGVRPWPTSTSGCPCWPWSFWSLHVLTAVVDTYVNVGWASVVVPFASPYRPLWTGLGTVGGRPHGGRGRVQRPPPADRGPDLAGHPLVGLRELAGGHGPLLGEGTDAATVWMDVLAGAVHGGRRGLARLADRGHRRSRGVVGAHVGASAGHWRPRRSARRSPARSPSTAPTRLLEREPR